jgi:hypothetical protein
MALLVDYVFVPVDLDMAFAAQWNRHAIAYLCSRTAAQPLAVDVVRIHTADVSRDAAIGAILLTDECEVLFRAPGFLFEKWSHG